MYPACCAINRSSCELGDICYFQRNKMKSKWWKVLFLLIQIVLDVYAATHWVVTENGRIQSQADSPFHLRRSYDLITLLDQETRRTDIDNIYQDLVSRKASIDKKWSGLEGAGSLESRFYAQDRDCQKAGKRLSDIDVYATIFTNGSSREPIARQMAAVTHEFQARPNNCKIVPDCTHYKDLDFSMFAYEHLQAMLNRMNLELRPESALAQLLPVKTLEDFADVIDSGLKKNSSSWLHYNFGVLYWRIRGDAYKAIECARRALWCVPREYRDLALLNLAGVLHKSRQSKAAAVLLHDAITHAPEEVAHHIALGNVYVALSDYNRSLTCYDNVLKLQPDMKIVVVSRHAVLCHNKLNSGLKDLHESLQGVLSELHNYHGQQQQWLRLQERLLWEQAPLQAAIEHNQDKMSSFLSGGGQRCSQRVGDHSNPTITCDLTDKSSLDLDNSISIQKLLDNVESETMKINEHINKNLKSLFSDGINLKKGQKMKKQKVKKEVKVKREDVERDEPPVLHAKYPTTLPTSSNTYFDATDWPSKEECTDWNLSLGVEEDELKLPVYLPVENKGFQVTMMLTDSINLPGGSEHELPWFPPKCEIPTGSVDKLNLRLEPPKQFLDVPLNMHPFVQQHFVHYVNNGAADEAEIGQRIITAMHKKTGPAWTLSTLASLYWRIRGNVNNALICLNVAFQTVPKDILDVPLVSMASIFQQLGAIDESLELAKAAFKVNYVEPSTNFLLALLYYAKNNPILAMYYMKNALRVDPNHYDGVAEKFLKTWACRIKMGAYEDAKKPAEGTCLEKDAIQGQGVICSRNGEQCKTAEIQCFRTNMVNEDIAFIKRDATSKLFTSGQQCNKQKQKTGLGHSLINTLLAAEESSGHEPDQSQLESMIDPQRKFHMRISLGDDHGPSGPNTLGDFYVSVSLTDDPTPEAMLQVYDKSGTYPLSPHRCKNIRDADWLKFSSMWQSVAARSIDIGPYLKPIIVKTEQSKPHCSDSALPLPANLDNIFSSVLKERFVNSPDDQLSEWLQMMAGAHYASVNELGTKIGIALQENTTSWLLATAAAFYWRVVGDTSEALQCLRHALAYVPNDVKDIPLLSLSNVLQRLGFYTDALEVAYMALESHPNLVMNHFTIGNIYTTLGDLEKAISFYRSSLGVDANFEPARHQLQVILCTLLFDEAGSLRDMTDLI